MSTPKDRDQQIRKELGMAFIKPFKVKKEDVTFDGDQAWRSRPPYKTGDGEVTTILRPGSLDFLKCKTRGFDDHD